MNIQAVQDALFWCAIMNFGLLAIWALLFVLPHEWLHRLWSRWFHMPVEQFDAINFAGIVFYKVAIILFCLTPYLALRIIK